MDLMLLLITLRLILSPMVFGCQRSERLDLLLHKITMSYKIIANGVNVSYLFLYTNALTNKVKECSLGLSTLSDILCSGFVFHLCNEVGFESRCTENYLNPSHGKSRLVQHNLITENHLQCWR